MGVVRTKLLKQITEQGQDFLRRLKARCQITEQTPEEVAGGFLTSPDVATILKSLRSDEELSRPGSESESEDVDQRASMSTADSFRVSYVRAVRRSTLLRREAMGVSDDKEDEDVGYQGVDG